MDRHKCQEEIVMHICSICCKKYHAQSLLRIVDLEFIKERRAEIKVVTPYKISNHLLVLIHH